MNTEEPLRLYVTREENKGSNIENMYREDRDSGKLKTLYTNILNIYASVRICENKLIKASKTYGIYTFY